MAINTKNDFAFESDLWLLQYAIYYHSLLFSLFVLRHWLPPWIANLTATTNEMSVGTSLNFPMLQELGPPPTAPCPTEDDLTNTSPTSSVFST